MAPMGEGQFWYFKCGQTCLQRDVGDYHTLTRVMGSEMKAVGASSRRLEAFWQNSDQSTSNEHN